MSTPFEKSRIAFNKYAAMGEGEFPDNPGSRLQVLHYRWAQNKVPKHTLPAEVEGVLGMCEELGEVQDALNQLNKATGKLAHIVLNASQGRRGYDQYRQKLRELIADGLADHGIFAHHLATAMRLDYWTLVHATAMEVIERDWIKNPLTAAKKLCSCGIPEDEPGHGTAACTPALHDPTAPAALPPTTSSAVRTPPCRDEVCDGCAAAAEESIRMVPRRSPEKVWIRCRGGCGKSMQVQLPYSGDGICAECCKGGITNV